MLSVCHWIFTLVITQTKHTCSGSELAAHLLPGLALPLEMAFIVEQRHVIRVLEEARRDVEWAADLTNIEAYLSLPQQDFDPTMWRQWLELYLWAWPSTLLHKLPWGPQPHFWALGGMSGFAMEQHLDTLNRVVTKTVELSGRSAATDLAWRRIARMGIVQRRCPECGMSGPAGQMQLYGAIMAGVTWGGATY